MRRDLKHGRRVSALAAPAALAAAAVAAGFSAGHAAAQVVINPVVLELGAGQRSTPLTLSLSAGAPGPVVLQAQVLRWRQSLKGTALHEPSDELVVAPPIIELRPGESQLVRVALRAGRSGPSEQAFRLMLEDATPPAPDAASGGGLSFRMRYDLPVMLAPAVPVRQQLRWSGCAAPATHACVRLANEGNRRVSLHRLELSGAGWSVPLEVAGVVLAHSEREWRLPLPAGAAGSALRVAAQTSTGERLGADLVPR